VSEDPTAWKERQHELKMGCPGCGGMDTIITRKTSGSIHKHCTVDECSWEYSTARKDDYSWVTDEMYDEALLEICSQERMWTILRIEGVYECVKEHYNNDVLASLEASRGEEE
jgi:hypothetical protein